MSGVMVLKERIDATEALIAIDLDNRRNELVAFDLVSGFCICRVQGAVRAANDIVLQAAAWLSHALDKGEGGGGPSPAARGEVRGMEGPFGRGRQGGGVTALCRGRQPWGHIGLMPL